MPVMAPQYDCMVRGKFIDQFMWAFQHIFRPSVRHETERALSNIGMETEVRVVLVGFALDETARHQICVEPEEGPLDVGHLSTVLERADDLFHSDPESRMHHTVSSVAETRQADLWRRSRAGALAEAIEASGSFSGRTFFASGSTPIGGYEVHTCIGVSTADLDALPALELIESDRGYVWRSLQHEVIAECLRRADSALYAPEPGAALTVLGAAEDIVKAAAVRLAQGLVFRSGGVHSDLFAEMNKITSMTYERTGAKGRLVIADEDRTGACAHVQFQRPISLYDTKIMRKLLALSGDTTAVLLGPGLHAYGLGVCEPAPNVIEVSVRGHAEWELAVEGSPLLRVAYGLAKLPRPPFGFDKFKDTAERTVGQAEIDYIWRVVQQAKSAGRGMTIVVSHDPEAEIERLIGEAVPLLPDRLEMPYLVRFGGVDGAVVLGPEGRCHAFGVILDGTADGRGDPARGSRYNSAVRYQRTMAPQSLLVVISDDGTVDLIPHLMPKVRKEDVEAAVEDFCAACSEDIVDGERFASTHKRVRELSFYLSEDQCRRVNDCHASEMRRRVEAGEIAAQGPPLRPHPDMDESYFV